jgi:hypothetical protein
MFAQIILPQCADVNTATVSWELFERGVSLFCAHAAKVAAYAA